MIFIKQNELLSWEKVEKVVRLSLDWILVTKWLKARCLNAKAALHLYNLWSFYISVCTINQDHDLENFNQLI